MPTAVTGELRWYSSGNLQCQHASGYTRPTLTPVFPRDSWLHGHRAAETFVWRNGVTLGKEEKSVWSVETCPLLCSWQNMLGIHSMSIQGMGPSSDRPVLTQGYRNVQSLENAQQCYQNKYSFINTGYDLFTACTNLNRTVQVQNR